MISFRLMQSFSCKLDFKEGQLDKKIGVLDIVVVAIEGLKH